MVQHYSRNLLTRCDNNRNNIMKIINSENTVRNLKVEFENDEEYLEFIKLLACSSKLQGSKIHSWWSNQHEIIITNDKLNEQYSKL